MRRVYTTEKTGYGIYGWRSIKRYAYRMENINQEATLRMAALQFWNTHGLAATLDAYRISRRTLYRWKQLCQASNGALRSLGNPPIK